MKVVQIKMVDEHYALVASHARSRGLSVSAYARNSMLDALPKSMSVQLGPEVKKPSQPMLAVDGHHYIIGTLTPTADGLWFNYHTTDLKRHHEAMAADATPEAMARAITLAGHLY